MPDSFIEKADDFMRAAANAATFGAADYIAAYGNRAIFGGTAAENVAAQDKYTQIAEERSPDTFFAGKIAGSTLAAEALSLAFTGENLLTYASDASLKKIIGLAVLSAVLNTALDGKDQDGSVTAEPATTQVLSEKLAPQNETGQQYLPPLKLDY